MRKTITAAAVAVAATALTAGTLVADAATAKGQTETFTIAGSNPSHLTLVAHGAITAGGYDVSPNGPSYDIVHLPGGTFRVNHPDKDATFSSKTNPKTCYSVFSEKGRYTLSNGTGKFAGVSGHGTYTGTGEGILARTKAGACNDDAEPSTLIFIVHGSGPITLK